MRRPNIILQSEAGNEKYEKIRRQKQKVRNMMLLVTLLGIAILATLIVVDYVDDEVDVDAQTKTKSNMVRQAHSNTVDQVDEEARAPRPPDHGVKAEAQPKKALKGHDLPSVSIETLEKEVAKIDAEVRRIKETGVIMEVDPESLTATGKLQEATRKLLAAKYGAREPYRVKLTLEFQPSIPDYDENGKDGSVTFEMAPARLVPHSVYTFLEIARTFKKAAFHRVAGHVLQAMVRGKGLTHLAFQEYSDEFPHVKGTVGYAGRPSGPAFYISIVNNAKNHGPGSQQKENPYEADSCFGKVVEGFDGDVQRIRKMPGREFVSGEKHVFITKMEILVPVEDGGGRFVKWQDPSPNAQAS